MSTIALPVLCTGELKIDKISYILKTLHKFLNTHKVYHITVLCYQSINVHPNLDPYNNLVCYNTGLAKNAICAQFSGIRVMPRKLHDGWKTAAFKASLIFHGRFPDVVGSQHRPCIVSTLHTGSYITSDEKNIYISQKRKK